METDTGAIVWFIFVATVQTAERNLMVSTVNLN